MDTQKCDWEMAERGTVRAALVVHSSPMDKYVHLTYKHTKIRLVKFSDGNVPRHGMFRGKLLKIDREISKEISIQKCVVFRATFVSLPSYP